MVKPRRPKLLQSRGIATLVQAVDPFGYPSVAPEYNLEPDPYAAGERDPLAPTPEPSGPVTPRSYPQPPSSPTSPAPAAPPTRNPNRPSIPDFLLPRSHETRAVDAEGNPIRTPAAPHEIAALEDRLTRETGEGIELPRPPRRAPTVPYVPDIVSGDPTTAPPSPHVLPPAEDEEPVVAPEPATGPADIEDILASYGLGGQGQTLEELDEYMKSRYPDLDFRNPAQEKADAYAARDLERTSTLATLAFAGALTSGAGPAYEGWGKGFTQAAGVYDEGFAKYQNALQKSADRYQDQSKTRQAYDLARRSAALDLYTTTAKEDRSDRRQVLKEIHDRTWERVKLTSEEERAERKRVSDDLNRLYLKKLDQYKPDPANIDTAAEEQKARMYARTVKEFEEALRRGEAVTSHELRAAQ